MIPGSLQNLRQGGMHPRNLVIALRDLMRAGVQAGEHRSVRWDRPLGGGDGALEDGRILREVIQRGRGFTRVTVDRQAVAALGIEHDEEDVRVAGHTNDDTF